LWHTFIIDGKLDASIRPGLLSRLKIAWMLTSTPCTVYLTDMIFTEEPTNAFVGSSMNIYYKMLGPITKITDMVFRRMG
jgi:hypothetical protein